MASIFFQFLSHSQLIIDWNLIIDEYYLYVKLPLASIWFQFPHVIHVNVPYSVGYYTLSIDDDGDSLYGNI